MACAKLEHEALLYTSNELDIEQRTAYEQHLEECEECREEVAFYGDIHVLGESSLLSTDAIPERVDQAIAQMCVEPLISWSPLFFSNAFRKVALPVFLLVCGFYLGNTFLSPSSTEVTILATSPVATPELAITTPVADTGDIDTLSPADSMYEYRQGSNTGVITVGGRSK